MGLSIGQTASQLPVARTLSAPRSGSAVQSESGTARNSRAENDAGPRVGFGSNTLSAASAALVTLDTNLERAREIVPTVEELRAQLRASRAEDNASLRAAQSEEQRLAATEPPETVGFVQEEDGTEAVRFDAATDAPSDALPPPTSFRPASAPQVRAFAQIDDAASRPSTGNAPSATSTNTQAFTSAPQTRLDVLV